MPEHSLFDIPHSIFTYHRLTTFYPIADLYRDLNVDWHQYVGPGAKLYQAKPLAAFKIIALGRPADNSPGEYSGYLGAGDGEFAPGDI